MKTKIQLFSVAVAMLSFVACSESDVKTPAEENPTTNQPTGAPVETGQANTTYTPAFAGQTRINSVQTTTPYQSTILNSSLSAPWGIVALPDGRFLVTEKAGNMRILTSTGTASAPITGFPVVNNSGQGGLLDVCIDQLVQEFSNKTGCSSLYITGIPLYLQVG